ATPPSGLNLNACQWLIPLFTTCTFDFNPCLCFVFMDCNCNSLFGFNLYRCFYSGLVSLISFIYFNTLNNRFNKTKISTIYLTNTYLHVRRPIKDCPASNRLLPLRPSTVVKSMNKDSTSGPYWFGPGFYFAAWNQIAGTVISPSCPHKPCQKSVCVCASTRLQDMIWNYFKDTVRRRDPRVCLRIGRPPKTPLNEVVCCLAAIVSHKPHEELAFTIKLASMKAGYSHKTASPVADMLAFRKIEEFMRVTTCVYFIQGYSLTETLEPSTVCYIDDMALVGSAGVPMGYDPLGVPSHGEICIRGKYLFSGYYKSPELTNEAIVDGWFHTGEYVAVEYLEKVYGFPPLVEDIWVYGDSFKSSLVAVVNPHEENTMKWAESNGYKGGLKEYIPKELTTIAHKNKVRFEYIKGIVLDPVPFDIERDLVTAKTKKRRKNMLNYYQ
ncbi:hypothetical protein ACJX0J_034887, partial [Zea mays]